MLSLLHSPTLTSIHDHWKNTRQTFVGKVMSLLFNTRSRLVIAFLPRSKHLLISWLQSPSAVILEPKKIKSLTVSIVSPSAAAKSLQSYPTLCDPIDGSPPGSSVHGIFQARVLEWGAIAFTVRSHHFMANRWGNKENNERLYFLGLQNHCRL